MLIICDCDGVLVDSEPISNRILAADITAAGWPMTTAESIARFKGGRLIEVQRDVEKHLGVELGDTKRRRPPQFGDVFELVGFAQGKAGARSCGVELKRCIAAPDAVC